MKMTINKLKEKLYDLEISEKEYSLNGELIFDAINLCKNYSTWEVFYFDEKGNRENEKNFDNEDDACKYVLKLFKDAKEIEQKFKIKTK
jgi:hypothetical protein